MASPSAGLRVGWGHPGRSAHQRSIRHLEVMVEDGKPLPEPDSMVPPPAGQMIGVVKIDLAELEALRETVRLTSRWSAARWNASTRLPGSPEPPVRVSLRRQRWRTSTAANRSVESIGVWRRRPLTHPGEDDMRLALVPPHTGRAVGAATEHRVLHEMFEAGMQAVQVLPRRRQAMLFYRVGVDVLNVGGCPPREPIGAHRRAAGLRLPP